jgi:hypothetical protein
MQQRLTASFWIKAHIRRLMGEAIPAMVARRGDDSAGAILVKLNCFENGCMVFAAGHSLEGDRVWRRATGIEPVPEADADSYIDRQIGYDPDIWVLEIEDRKGRHFLPEPVEDG